MQPFGYVKRTLAGVLVAASTLSFSSFVYSDSQWFDTQATYSLKAFHLFRLKKQLTPEQLQAIKPLRDQVFASADDFQQQVNAALDGLTLDADAMDKLLTMTKSDVGQVGFEFIREDLIKLSFKTPDADLTEPGITQESWLNLPEKEVEITATDDLWQSGMLAVRFDGQCLQVFDAGTDAGTDQGPDLTKEQSLLGVCHTNQPKTGIAADLAMPGISHIYGLGQQFHDAGKTVANRMGTRRDGLNVMEGFNGGANGNTNFPVAYALGKKPSGEQKQFALFLDNRYPHEWHLEKGTSKVSVNGGEFDLYLLAGNSLKNLRQKYMAMVGNPLVPPKVAFGLWLSEYGYDNWQELDDKLASLEKNQIPISGVVMDLQWFGNVIGNSQMGSLTWDETHFPKPAEKIAEYKQRGLGMMVIEESYIDEGLAEYKTLAEKQFLASDPQGKPLPVNPNGGGQWWGDGGMMDWLQPEAGDFWHDYRRQDLINMGVMGHWTDLGEPEMFNPDFLYGADDINQTQAHNSFNLEWIKSIYRGYERNEVTQRPFIMSRSGGVGMQRYGGMIWSGDIGSDYGSLAAQMPQQTHMFWSGMDYYGSDIGGFHRAGLQSGLNDRDAMMDELYTQWLAYAAMVEVPIRPHTENLCNCKETSPDRIGDLDSNRDNLLLRYSLIPYYYSLAHGAYESGKPVFPALVHEFQEDENTWDLGHQKLIGPSLMTAAVAEYGAKEVDVYLPKGTWFDYRTGKPQSSSGEWTKQALYRENRFSLPLLARDGAMVPSLTRYGLTLKVFGLDKNVFVWADDDGLTNAYRSGAVQRTAFRTNNGRLSAHTLQPGNQGFSGIQWYLPEGKTVQLIRLNGRTFDKQKWRQVGNVLHIDSGFGMVTQYHLIFE